MIRPSGAPQSSGQAGTGGSGGTGGGGGGGGGGGDLFVAFLDADEQTRHQSQSSQGSFPLDWPVHSNSASGGGGNPQSGGSVPSTSSSGAAGSGINPLTPI